MSNDVNRPTLTLIHTAPLIIPTFNALAKQHLPNVNLVHMVDESLIKETTARGELRKDTVRRMVNLIDSAERAGADAVVVTCSSIGPGVEWAKPLFDIPVVRIDEAMAEQAVQMGPRIGVMATIATTFPPTLGLLREKAAEAGREVELIESLCAEAFQAIAAGDPETHDRLLTAAILDLGTKVDVVVLAQGSMARVAPLLAAAGVAVPVLTTPETALLRAKSLMNA